MNQMKFAGSTAPSSGYRKKPGSMHACHTDMITSRKAQRGLIVAVGIGLLLSGCSGAADADRTSIENSLREYLDMLEDDPQPAADDVLAWVSNDDAGKEKARAWLTRHPDAQAHVDSYLVSDPYESDSNEPEAKLSVNGRACPEPDQCRPYPTETGTINLRREGGQYLLDADIALKFFGYEK
ncbi:hypothetical protein GCM10022222_08250 [Amycolatopsis ultiminotia]|uniref:Lipoprotein n=1 Tax=Amycolatopsis ultiminotia TaxID=543629 RepID=A0ABP6V6C0_9PSEU